jgi:CDP-4-dehydro-6-deoxyglucose reductase, E1
MSSDHRAVLRPPAAAMNTPVDIERIQRELVLESCRQYFAGRPPGRFVAGETYIPVTGKVLDAEDLVHLVDASLDLWLTAGRYASELEQRLAGYFGLKHASLTNSGSSANLLAFSALTSPKLNVRLIAPGSEVLTVAAGFPTTVAPIIQNGCIPVFVDVDLATANVDASRLAAAVTPKTRAIMLAHTLGNPFDLRAVTEIAKAHRLYLIEDCCDALGATFDGRKVGTFGDVATLSFYPAHQITMGEGGAVLTNRASTNKLINSFRDWGRDCWCDPGKDNTCGQRFDWKLGDLPRGYDHKYTYSHVGYNLKVTDMQAAVGLSQLAKVDAFVARRRENFAAYRAAFLAERLDEHFLLPQATAGGDPSWFGFLVTIRDGSPLKRLDVVRYLEEHRIGTRQLFAGNLTRQPALKSVDFRVVGPLANTDKIMNDSFWIGVWPGIGAAERTYVIETFRRMVGELTR